MTLDVLTLGEVMLSLQAPGPLAPGSRLAASIAGAEANVAIGLARLGHRSAWVGRVGDDEAGALVRSALRGQGVEVRATTDDAATGIMVRRERLPGVTKVDYHRRFSAGAALSPDDVLPHLQEPPRWLHLTGITPALSASARATVAQAASIARKSGTKVCLDVNHRARLWSREDAMSVLTPLARLADVVVASEDELPLVSATPEQLIETGASLVAVKRGSEGAVLYGQGSAPIERAAVRVRAVDAVGAGDAFCAGLLSGLLDGLDAHESLDRAVLLGAFAVSTVGDWEGLPNRSELHLLSLSDGEVIR